MWYTVYWSLVDNCSLARRTPVQEPVYMSLLNGCMPVYVGCTGCTALEVHYRPWGYSYEVPEQWF